MVDNLYVIKLLGSSMSSNSRKSRVPISPEERSQIVELLLKEVPQRKIGENIGRNKDIPRRVSKKMREVIKGSIEIIESSLSVSDSMRVELLRKLINVSLSKIKNKAVETDTEALDRLIEMLLQQRARNKKRKTFDIGRFRITDKSYEG